MVTVYSKKNCPQCTMTTRVLDAQGTQYKLVSLEENPEIAQQFVAEGFLSAPIVETPAGERWAGFIPAKLKTLASTN